MNNLMIALIALGVWIFIMLLIRFRIKITIDRRYIDWDANFLWYLLLYLLIAAIVGGFLA
jgi:hypothetical protein